jgi:hypothetical protein
LIVQGLRDVQQRGHAGGVIHGAVVNRIAVDRFADAHVIEVRGEHDVLVLERRIGAWPYSDHVLRLQLSFSTFALARKEGTSGKCGSGLPALTNASSSSKVWPEPSSHLPAWAGFTVIAILRPPGGGQAWVGQFHGLLKTGQRGSAPRDIGVLGF